MKQITQTLKNNWIKDTRVVGSSKQITQLVRFKPETISFLEVNALDFIDDKFNSIDLCSKKDKFTRGVIGLSSNYYFDRGFDMLNKFKLMEIFNKDDFYEQETYYASL